STYIYDLPPRVTPPTIILDPMTHTVCLGGQTSLVADASGTSPNWQWHYSPDGVVPFLPLVDGPGGPGNAQVSGSQTARLRMADLTVGGHFQAVATNLGGTAVSAPAELTLDTIFKPGSSTVNTVATDISDLLLTDLDGDGDRDIVVANRSGNPDLLVFHNDGLGNFGSSIDLSLGTGCSASSICVADLGTAGGRAILVACPGTQSIELLDTSSLALLPSRAVPGGGEVVSLQCCDLEGVGISDDLLTVSLDPTTGNFQVQQHPGGVLSGGALYAHLQLLDARCNDLDQDGWLDTVVARSDSFVSLIRGQAGSPVPAGDLDLSSFGSVVIPNLLRCQDLTGDAFPEIVVGIAASPAWPEGGVVIFVHDGLPGPINPSHYLISGPHVGFALPEDVAVGDLFGDSVPGFVGHYDLVLASSDDVAQFTALETSGVFSAEVHCGSDQIKLVRLGDLNGDATLDQVIAHTDGRLTVSCSTNRPVAQAYGSSCTGSNGSPQISGTPAVVNAVQAILLNGGRSNSAAILGVSTNPVMNELGPGCTIYLGAPVLTFSRTTNAIGQSSFGYLIPPGTEGVELYFQWIIFDPNGALNGVLAMSDALKVKIGS
ncbi:MAG: VCBS repeat-containing protein, partial [Planctomycetes bacterium]|nr:VCBS repeat-containing protein [Planctomycetota bacterium]